MRTAPRIDRWNAQERKVLDKLTSPAAVQALLDAMVYSSEPVYRCPRSVLRDRKAHCMDGALLAAYALWRLGHRPLLLDLRAVRDDDHVIAPFRGPSGWGAVAKSNFAGLRYREPIYRTVRELAMSYFELYFNVRKEKTLRAYSVPVDLRAVHGDWLYGDEVIEQVVERLDRSRHFPMLSRAAVRGLQPVDDRSYAAGLLGANEAGLYQP